MLWLTSNKRNNAGFSLVELIIVVSILAIAAIPLMKSMGMASKVNARAQSIQNATSLAESVMEEVKSSSIKQLVADNGGFNEEGKCIIKKENEYAAQSNEKFTVNITIDINEYSNGVPSEDESEPEGPAPLSEDPESPEPLSTTAKVKSANTLALPSIDDIDTMTQAVLTSSKEINRFDEAAQSFFNEKKKEYKPEEDASTKAVITRKVITIEKDSSIEAGYEIIRVNARVRYEGKRFSTDPNEKTIVFERDLYSGAFSSPEQGSVEGYHSPDSNIYIFYSRNMKLGDVPDEIIINDTVACSDPEDESDSHRVYLIMQNSDDPVPDISITKGGSTYNLVVEELTDGNYAYSTKTVDGKTIATGEIITNIDSHIYREEKKLRVYDITVVLTKDDDTTEYARLKSTVTANDDIP